MALVAPQGSEGEAQRPNMGLHVRPVEARRAEAPLECIVHIGNGRVSDRCGAEAADVVFAKETLADELTERGVPFQRFETLFDVVDSLKAGWGA